MFITLTDRFSNQYIVNRTTISQVVEAQRNKEYNAIVILLNGQRIFTIETFSEIRNRIYN